MIVGGLCLCCYAVLTLQGVAAVRGRGPGVRGEVEPGGGLAQAGVQPPQRLHQPPQVGLQQRHQAHHAPVLLVQVQAAELRVAEKYLDWKKYL